MEQPEKKKRGAQKGRVMSDAQREGLKKGFEALKAKREALKKEKELTKAAKPFTKDLPINNQAVVESPALVNPVPVTVADVPVAVAAVPDIKRKPKREVLTKDEFDNFKTEILNHLRPTEKTVERIVEKPVERVVEKIVYEPKVLSGSALLDSIFFR